MHSNNSKVLLLLRNTQKLCIPYYTPALFCLPSSGLPGLLVLQVLSWSRRCPLDRTETYRLELNNNNDD